MKTTPKTEKEIYEANLLPKGWYPFTVNDAKEKVSKAGNEMIEVNLRIYRGEGYSFVRDFLMDTEYGAAKLRHISDTFGVLDKYEAGGIDADDLTGKEGFCKITIKEDKSGQYPDQNQIVDYAREIPKKKGEEEKPGASKEAAGNDEASEDDIPF